MNTREDLAPPESRAKQSIQLVYQGRRNLQALQQQPTSEQRNSLRSLDQQIERLSELDGNSTERPVIGGVLLQQELAYIQNPWINFDTKQKYKATRNELIEIKQGHLKAIEKIRPLGGNTLELKKFKENYKFFLKNVGTEYGVRR